MNSSVRMCLGLVAVSCAFAFVGCGDDGDSGNPPSSGGQAQIGGAGSDGPAQCEEIAELCHPVDPGDGPIHNCHEQSEVGNTARCAEIHANCITICSAAYGAGGAGGATPGAAGAGGVEAGGAANAGGGEATGGAGGAGGAP